MASKREMALIYARDNRGRLIHDLFEFIKIPSVSADPDWNILENAASWILQRLKAAGIQKTQIFQTEGPPIVYGEYQPVQSPICTVLLYGHYDVQPIDPFVEWVSPPFEPHIKGEDLFGRGASDMKGQIIASIGAVEAILSQSNLPIAFKFLFEGEEEIGSPNLPRFLQEQRNLLGCDFALVPDTGMIAKDTPTITYGLRGLCCFELRVFGPKSDLHSGQYGGVVHNPAQALCELIAGMHDSEGRITLPGFYDRVLPISGDERKMWSELPQDDNGYKAQTGVKQLWGECGFSAAERVRVRPTLEVNGLLSGYTGNGMKTVIPACAMAKISMRLVPDQDPEDIKRQLIAYLEQQAPDTIRWELEQMAGHPPSVVERWSPVIQSLAQALETVWHTAPVFEREGSSIPIVGMIKKYLGIESVMTGFSLPEDNIHAPNEKIHLPTWGRGIDALVHFFYNLVEKAV